MVNVFIEDELFLDLLLDRVERWINSGDEYDLWALFYREQIKQGKFNGIKLDIKAIVDNNAINEYVIIKATDFDNYHIDLEKNPDRVKAQKNGLYLITTREQ